MARSIIKFLSEFSSLETQNNREVSEPHETDTNLEEPYDLRDMDSLLSTVQKEKIIDLIFKKNEEKYLRIMKLLNRIKTWEDASDLLELFFRSSGLNLNSDEAIEFTSIIRKCFDE
jgi:hypothetical protein